MHNIDWSSMPIKMAGHDNFLECSIKIELSWCTAMDNLGRNYQQHFRVFPLAPLPRGSSFQPLHLYLHQWFW